MRLDRKHGDTNVLQSKDAKLKAVLQGLFVFFLQSFSHLSQYQGHFVIKLSTQCSECTPEHTPHLTFVV